MLSQTLACQSSQPPEEQPPACGGSDSRRKEGTEEPLWESSSFQAKSWADFYGVHTNTQTPFFKCKRYLPVEFPCLRASGATVLEVGCGTGASVLPILRATQDVRVIACDFAANAVAACQAAVTAAGAPACIPMASVATQ